MSPGALALFAMLAASGDECVDCHAEITAQWRASRHAVSGYNDVFLAELRRFPRPWCVGCHAPGADLRAVLSGAARVGIDCNACHEREGFILSARPPSPAAEAAHPMRLDVALGTSAHCAPCHQFTELRPGAGYSPDTHPMQDTYNEWRASSFAARDVHCQDCHFPKGDHRGPGAYHVDMLRQAVSVEVTPRADGRFQVRLRSHQVGHRLPTGDPSKRLRLLLCADVACARVLAQAVVARELARDAQGHLVVARDTSIPSGGERVLELHTSEKPRRWRLEYWYAPQLVGHLSSDGLAVTLAEGDVGAP